ncbi:putative membrane protein [Candidatus Phytoplasma oryzae]|uniref:Putative membrane protein n=1 Tax=Candidatus Phytoplasma oryzae TaxID=203274 RepID=A0A139JQA7_9MOLU|nr:putative membrane protein [Candidatus Phytoplasma oryzae]KXT29157.1 putative membrane protein [Candidatus Phytoplasma oryzae]
MEKNYYLFKFQLIGIILFSFKYLLVLEKGFEPKKPLFTE